MRSFLYGSGFVFFVTGITLSIKTDAAYSIPFGFIAVLMISQALRYPRDT